MKSARTLRELFSMPGFTAKAALTGVFGDRYARVVPPRRRKTAVCSQCGHRCRGRCDQRRCQVRDLSATGFRIYLEFDRWRVNCPRCRSVRVERLDWLAKNPRYTQRFAMHVGEMCRHMTNKAVAELERIHDSTVKDLDKVYMAKQVELAGPPSPRVIGVDELCHLSPDSVPRFRVIGSQAFSPDREPPVFAR